MFPRVLKTAAEVRAHAVTVQRRIDEQFRRGRPKPAAREREPEPEPEAEAEPLIPDGPVRRIIRISADHHGKPLSVVLGGLARAAIVPRQIGCFVARRLGFDTHRIACGARRDRTTVVKANEKIEQQLAQGDQKLAEAVNAIGTEAAATFGKYWERIDVHSQAEAGVDRARDQAAAPGLSAAHSEAQDESENGRA
jgi:hypothetical protein